MPRNGSGTYQLPAGNPVVTNTTISSAGWANPTLADIAAALSASIAVDGQTVPTANLPMGNFRHLNVANGQNTNEYASVGQIQTAGFQLLGGTAGTINTTQPITAGVGTFTSVAAGTGIFTTGTFTSLSSTGNAASFGNGQNAEIDIIQHNANTNGQLFVSPTGVQGFYDIGRGLVRWSSDTSGSFNVASNLTAAGTISGSNITGTSDERLKEDWQPMDRDFLIRMSKVLHGTFSWKADGLRSAGVGAASLREAFPEAVHEDARGMLSAAYGHAALVTVLELIPIVLRLLDAHGETP
ncbi:tail fiber domain-containing protein [Burkholderia ambifaria]|uniref:tail fiber domain-containing protein n=1 Tax=Burkholderia ambifaria TaxID=152480 RepID=UPI001E5EB156|nr:tail fiber domain-containing protein [Burkholderia ambifaria]UEP23100.1 tail fiber domain-containing protein [Burkholderia ambifaria]